MSRFSKLYDMPKYGFDIFWSEEDQGYIATCPDFPGLSAFGDTEEDALQEAKTALGLFVCTLNDQGAPIPEATTASHFQISTAASTANRPCCSINADYHQRSSKI